MRFKFPNWVDGAIAASAPIYLIGRVSDRDFFFADVTKVSVSCFLSGNQVLGSFGEVIALVKVLFNWLFCKDLQSWFLQIYIHTSVEVAEDAFCHCTGQCKTI